MISAGPPPNPHTKSDLDSLFLGELSLSAFSLPLSPSYSTFRTLCLSLSQKAENTSSRSAFQCISTVPNLVHSGIMRCLCPYFVNSISKARYRGCTVTTAAHPAHREINADREGDRERADMFLPFHFFLQTQPGDRGGGMMVASACPRSTIGLPATSSVIYDAVKMYTVFSLASPRVTVLSQMPQTPRVLRCSHISCPFICPNVMLK